MDVASSVKAEVAYLDPPYNSRQYSDTYHLLENIALWTQPPVKGIAKKMDRTAIKSAFCGRGAEQEFAELIASLDCRLIVVSYNSTQKKLNGRSNAAISDEKLIEVLSARGSLRIAELKHKAFTTGKGGNSDNTERLFICNTQQS